MDIITGRFASASVFAVNIEDYAESQIRMILDNQVSINSKVCIMPDCHPGKVGPIGLTMTVTVVVAKSVGCTLPLIARRCGFDPAVMASPLITTIADALSLIVYFSVASVLLF